MADIAGTANNADERLTEKVSTRVTRGDAARLDALVGRLLVGDRSGVARAALRLGLDLLEEDVGRLVGAPAQRRGRK